MANPKIIISPLDWGLGHAARCVPIIKKLLEHSCKVIIAATPEQLIFFQKENWREGDILMIPFDGYNISYPYESMIISMITQMPKLYKSVRYERRALEKLIEKYQIDAVISDNRFGFYSKQIPSVYITHQIHIEPPSNMQLLRPALSRIHKRLINKFDYCWIPDWEGENNLAGKLSIPHPSLRGIPVIPATPITVVPAKAGTQSLRQMAKSRDEAISSKYKNVGILSRMNMIEGIEKDLDILVVLSGPEPQRSIFEDLVIKQLRNLSANYFIVRGLPHISEATSVIASEAKQPPSLQGIPQDLFINHLPTDELNRYFYRAKMILARPGYSTLMDLSKTGCKAVLVPTPGQTEQEYLAKYLLQKKWCYSESQDNFNINRMIELSYDYSGIPYNEQNDVLLDQAVVQLLERVT